MPKVKQEDRDLASGLIDDVDATITDLTFGVNLKYAEASGSNDPMGIFTLEGDQLEKPFDQGYSLGGTAKWQATRGGKEVISQLKPDSHVFHKNSRMGTIVDRMFALVGEGDAKKGQAILFKRVNDDRYMTEAEFYIGLAFHWKRENLPTLTAGETKPVLMPNAYLGEVKVEVKQAVGSVSEEDINKILAIVEGKTEREVKQIIVKKDSPFSESIKNAVFNKGLLGKLESEGKVTKDPASGKYV